MKYTPIPLLISLCFFMSSCSSGDSGGVDNGGPQNNMVSVSAKAAGRFGRSPFGDPPPGDEMVVGYVFSGPGVVTINATGMIDLTDAVPLPSNAFVDILPDGGAPIDRTLLGLADGYNPLEEAFVDANGAGSLPVDIPQGGALIGAFVPEAIVNGLGFQAVDDDVPEGGIRSDSLFFIGSGPTDFTAVEPGTLFLGINDPYAPNNVGAFDVILTTQ